MGSYQTQLSPVMSSHQSMRVSIDWVYPKHIMSNDKFLSKHRCQQIVFRFLSNMVSTDGFISNMVSSDCFISNMVSSDGFISNMVSSDAFVSNTVSSDGFSSNMVSRDQPYSQRLLEISLQHRFLPQKMIENAWERVTKRALTCAWKKLWSESVVECDTEESETAPCGAYSQQDCVFGQDQGSGGG
ncbi:hypothetical protein AVEN_115735-1 [Araneus ventricosus]|uniref:Uncharacterized protein n=1 Tax=Araneus ventricosus TaxID=182803 RepID=A0A4Y2X091_ARAVE|nr:hypothetical protein AVEN_115735-1 [Araneus ventricosus]